MGKMYILKENVILNRKHEIDNETAGNKKILIFLRGFKSINNLITIIAR